MINTKEFEALLRAEKKKIEETLSSSSKRSSKNPNDWETSFPDFNIDTSDKNDLADEVEEFDNALGINSVLEEKYQDIVSALERIAKGTFGKCEKGGEEIDEKRLRANPSARTCVKHSE